MEATFKYLESNRKILLNFLNTYTKDQLNYIPDGLNNNIIWNIGHVIVVQQAIVYKLSGLPMQVSEDLFNRYKNGSLPSTNVSIEEINLFKDLLLSTVEQTKKDYENGLFVNYKEFTTTTGFHLTSAKEANVFNNFHEGIHLGFMLKIKSFIK